MSKYKGFGKQLSECRENGILVREYCPHCGRMILICKKHGGQCISRKCKEERRGNE